MITPATTPADDLDLCKRTAHILGEQSAAARALADYTRLRSEGLAVRVCREPWGWSVSLEQPARKGDQP